MTKQPLVVLLGDSLILDSVEASLAGRQAFSVLRLRTAHPEVAQRLNSVAPSLVIFDLDAPSLRSILPFLRAEPGVPLLGVDVDGDIAVSLVCEHHIVQNVIDLQGIIRTHLHAGTQEHHIPHPITDTGALSMALRAAGS